MTRSLRGKTAVVTGAGSGIGRGVALRLAEDHANIAVWDLNPAGAEETVQLIRDAGGSAAAIVADCSREDAIREAAAKTRAAFGAITILVNNAGIATFCPYLDITEEAWDEMIRINLKGPHLVIREILPDMIAAQWGRIINVTSSSTQTGSQLQANYVASKGGLFGLTKALAMEFAKHGVTVNAIPPGSIDTPMLRGAPIDGDAFGKTLPVGRLGLPADIGAAAAYLASEEASYVTGQTISTNGGRYMGSA